MGERYSQSLDVGKELEKESKPAESPPEVPIKENSVKEETTKSQDAAKEAAPEPVVSEPVPEEPAEEEFVEDSPAPPDALEEEVLEILTNDIPRIKQGISIWERLSRYKFVLGLLLFVGIGAWLWSSLMVTHEPVLQELPVPQPEIFLAEPQEPVPEPIETAEAVNSVDELPDFFAEMLKD